MDHIENLIRAGANINERDNNGKTPLMYAVSQAVYVKIINYLITKGADVKAKDNNNKSVVEYCRYNECRDIIKTALKGH